MSEHKEDSKDFFSILKSDVRESVDLYFAPVRAVVREFHHAIERNGNGKGDSGSAASRSNHDMEQRAH